MKQPRRKCLIDVEWLENERDVPATAVKGSWMVGVGKAEDRTWRFVGRYPDSRKRALPCSCAASRPAPWEFPLFAYDGPPAPIRLAPLLSDDGNGGTETFLIGQCKDCGTVLWGTVDSRPGRCASD